jgi:RNA polymerase sigma-70 factor (ECF subfamily)
MTAGPKPMPSAPERAELDELTLARARRGDAAAFRRLVETYQRGVFAILSRMLGPRGRRARVEDLAQETFLRVFRALPGFDPAGGARLSSWILTIATRLALSELERVDRVVPLTAAAEVAAPRSDHADAAHDRRETRDALERAVRELEPGFQAVFLLRELHELSYDEIALALDIDVGTVKSRLHRAREKLRVFLEERT